MRKILIGAVLALCFLMISLTLVGKTLPRATGPAETSAKEIPRIAGLHALRRDLQAKVVREVDGRAHDHRVVVVPFELDHE